MTASKPSYSPGAVAFLQLAALMNGKCDRCGRILPHPDSGEEHLCPDQKDPTLDKDGWPKQRPQARRPGG